MRCLFRVFLAILVLFISTGCSDQTFDPGLKNSEEVIIKSKNYERKLTDIDDISNLADILNKSKKINPPEKVKGIHPELADEAVSILFNNLNHFVYVGDGYLYHNAQYYSVSKDIEKYTQVSGLEE